MVSFVDGRVPELVPFNVDTAHPITFFFQTLHQMTADKTAGARY